MLLLVLFSGVVEEDSNLPAKSLLNISMSIRELLNYYIYMYMYMYMYSIYAQYMCFFVLFHLFYYNILDLSCMYMYVCVHLWYYAKKYSRDATNNTIEHLHNRKSIGQ